MHQHLCNKNLTEDQLRTHPNECDMSNNVGLAVFTGRMKNSRIYTNTPPLRMINRGEDGFDLLGFSLSGFYSRLIRAWVSSTVVAQEVANLITVWVASLRSQKSKATCLDSSFMRSLSKRTKV